MSRENGLEAYECTVSGGLIAVKTGELCEECMTGGSFEEPSVFTP